MDSVKISVSIEIEQLGVQRRSVFAYCYIGPLPVRVKVEEGCRRMAHKRFGQSISVAVKAAPFCWRNASASDCPFGNAAFIRPCKSIKNGNEKI